MARVPSVGEIRVATEKYRNKRIAARKAALEQVEIDLLNERIMLGEMFESFLSVNSTDSLSEIIGLKNKNFFYDMRREYREHRDGLPTQRTGGTAQEKPAGASQTVEQANPVPYVITRMGEAEEAMKGFSGFAVEWGGQVWYIEVEDGVALPPEDWAALSVEDMTVAKEILAKIREVE